MNQDSLIVKGSEKRDLGEFLNLGYNLVFLVNFASLLYYGI